MNVWFLYLVRNKYGHLYTGITTDINRRFNEHSEGGNRCAKALRGKGPLTLAFSCEIGSYSDALKLEAKVKKLSKIQKESLIAQQPGSTDELPFNIAN